jgi:hypothetical protein
MNHRRKVRTTFSLKRENYDWLCQHAPTLAEQGRIIDELIEQARDSKPLVDTMAEHVTHTHTLLEHALRFAIAYAALTRDPRTPRDIVDRLNAMVADGSITLEGPFSNQPPTPRAKPLRLLPRPRS